MTRNVSVPWYIILPRYRHLYWNWYITSIILFNRDKEWIKAQKMEAFLSVAKGSEEPPVFLELEYKGNNSSDTPPVALVGKGVTFDR